MRSPLFALEQRFANSRMLSPALSRIGALAALGLYVGTWWWTEKLTREAMVDEYTRFSPMALGVFLVLAVVVGSVLGVAALVRLAGNPGRASRGLLTTVLVASVIVWTAAISLGFVTLYSIA